MNSFNVKNILTLPYKLTLSTLNYLQDKFSSQPRTETFDDVKIKDEMKEERMTFEDLVMTRGFPLEIHWVHTEDGYILKLYRIPGGKSESNYRKKQKQSILLMHGIFDSSDGWVCNNEDKCIPFILANLGYDIWLGNSRGNKHSRHHLSYKDDSYEMWNFSFHEMGIYDLPAFLNHITQINSWSQKVIYIGHSQGTTQLFASISMNLDYFASKIKLFIALAPAARVYNMNSKLLKLLRYLKIDILCEKLSFWEVLCSDSQLEKVSSWVMPKFPFLSHLMMELISDSNSQNYNAKRMSIYHSHIPGGSSIKAISHFVQMSKVDSFRMYDYGKKINLEIYGTEEPKEYDLKTVHDFPVALFSGREDMVAHPEDVKWLVDQLGENIVCDKKYEKMGHSTFVIGENMEWFKDVIDLLDLYC
jgi:lysosomal acid lipase/cholesteryl ester hydrolase